MIVITRLGRSGRSLLAPLYRELVCGPGSKWSPNFKGGLKDLNLFRLEGVTFKRLGFRALEVHDGVLTVALSALKPLLSESTRRHRFRVARRRV